MPAYLNEDEVDADPTEIAYPHLLLCMGVTLVMGDGSLIGAHFSTGSTEASVGAAMRALMELTPATPRWMYVTGNFAKHANDGGSDPAGKANLIGYRGRIGCFDTAILEPRHGTFVKLTSLGQIHGALVEYKRDEKMLYETSPVILPGRRVTSHMDYAGTRSGKPLHRAELTYIDV